MPLFTYRTRETDPAKPLRRTWAKFALPLMGILAFSLPAWLPQSLFAQPPNGQESDVHPFKALDSVVGTDGPGYAALVWEKGAVKLEIFAGIANLDSKAKIDRNSVFRMASVSKQFTAMAVLLLAQEGALSLSDSIAEHLPELETELVEAIQIRHLLTHSSGIPDYEKLMGKDWDGQISDAQILDLLKGHSKLYFQPGTNFKYSNTGYCLLSLIVERVSGKPYRQFMQERIFQPLGMNSTFMYDASHLVPGRVMGYSLDSSKQVVPSDQSATSATLGDGCVYTSPADYLRWFQAIRDNKLVDLQAFSQEIAFELPVAPKSRQAGFYYGPGWFFTQTDSPTTESRMTEFTHSGSTCGFSNIVLCNPEADTLILVFSNLADSHDRFGAFIATANERLDAPFQLDWKWPHRLTD